MIDHDANAKRITERATLWIEDLIMSLITKKEEKQIQEEILRRYRTHFGTCDF
jgi:hypothetical protein